MTSTDPARVLDEIAREVVRPDLDLLPDVLANIQTHKHSWLPARKPATKLLYAGLLLAAVLIISFFTMPVVARAVRSLFGYIPGVGRVEQSAPLRSLAAPVQGSREGFNLTVESAVLDAARTVIIYRATGDFPRYDDPTLRPPMCPDLPVLRLPNGAVLAYPSGEGNSNTTESTWKLIYAALPADVNSATLVFECLPGLEFGEGPHDWAFALEFAPAPAALTVFPLINLPTTTPAPATRSATVHPQATAVPQASALHGFTWALNSMAVLPDGYYLETNLAWPPDPNAYEVQLYPDALHLADSSGQEASVWQAGDGVPFTPADKGFMPLNLQTGPLGSTGPARLTLNYVGFSRFADATFSFDAGSNPQPGQVWPIQQDLVVDGRQLHVRSAKYVDAPAPAMLLIELESNSGIMAVIAGDLEHETLDSGGALASDQGPMQAGWHYRGAFPHGMITVTISMITVRVNGPWTLEWTPPADSITPLPETPTPRPTLRPEQARCPVDALLQTATDRLPDGLTGRVAYSQWTGERNEVFISNLDGSSVIALGMGAFPDLSTDGRQVVFLGADEGLHVRDLASGAERLLPGSIHPGVYDNWPRWSPAGTLIAFYRATQGYDFDLYVMDADGSNLRAVASGPEAEHLIGWNADGSGLYYRAVGASGSFVRLLHLATGQTSEIARLPEYTLAASLSPDGSRLLILTEQALWLDRLDGSPAEALLATNGHFASQIYPLWSPDGRWVSINYWETPGEGLPRLALLDVDECRLVRLDNHPGTWLSDWVK